VQFGYGPDVLKAWPAIAPQVASEDAADLMQGQANLFAATGNVAGLRGLIGSSSYAHAPAETKAEVRYLLAKLLAAKQQWNEAIAEYKAVASLDSVHRVDALFAHYAILKEVQEPLNLAVAVPLLERALEMGSYIEESNSARDRALEELIPLYIYLGRLDEASGLAQEAASTAIKYPASDPDLARLLDQVAVGQFWQAYLGQKSDTDTVRNWSYYAVAADEGELVDPPGQPILDDSERPGGISCWHGADRGSR
jgi:hypothetical protein